VNRDAADIAASQFDLARVETCAQRQTDLPGSRTERQRASDRAARSIEGRQNAVTGGFDQISAMLLDNLSRELVVIIGADASADHPLAWRCALSRRCR
jgi:hypothetical protein